jgi:hypothetical protein
VKQAGASCLKNSGKKFLMNEGIGAAGDSSKA